MSNKFHGNYYDYQWNNGIPLVEENKEDEISYNGSNVYMGEELEYIDADDEDIKFDSNGNIDWTSVRNKYFSIYLKAKNVNKTEGVLVESPAKKESDIIEKNYFNNTIIFENSRLNQYQDSLTVYLGPLDYGILKYYECEFQELVMNRNWYEKFTRPIALVMIPIFSFLYKYIGNYGFVIIVFSILLKLLLYPLTKKSYQSMKEMALLQPIIGELREKYKDNPQKMNKELMGIYKKHGVNPMGGCLPNLLQMPILFAMFSLFRSTIQLRGQEFIFWIKDLSAPDVIPLGFSLPYIGDTFHLLPILSSVTMIFQSKQTTTDPKNKALVYMMPVMMLVFLYSFPSGLHLYYFVFNIFSFLQQKMIKEPVPLNEREKEKIKKIKHKK
jgi:YidC/Oxa1 family membrane protein insertase